jgi:cardiolipin synthase (CMP-forming)
VTPSGERDPLRLSDSSQRLRDLSGQVAQRAAREVRAALRPFTIPNGITLLRIALTPFFVLATLSANHKLALALFVAAGLSDAVDGLLARLLRMRSLIGSYLDPIADKLLLVSAFVALTVPEPGSVRIPLWLTVMALSRDLLIVLVALVLYLGAGTRLFPPSIWGKVTTFVEVLTVGLVLLANAFDVIPALFLLVLYYVSLALIIISGLDYVRRTASVVEDQHREESR